MLYNRLIEHVAMPAFDKLNGGSLTKYLRRYRKDQWLTEEELRRQQSRRLIKVLRFAQANCDYYKDIKLQKGLTGVEMLSRFPVVRKADIKPNIDRFVVGDKSQYIREASSGSSGIQGVVYLDKEAQSSHRAIQILWWEWAGYQFGAPILQTGITPQRGMVKAMKDKVLRTDYIPAYSMEADKAIGLLRQVERNPVKHFMGYASSLYVFAQIAQQNGIDGIKLKSCVSWGDKMFPHFRKLIEAQFHTRVHDTYACTEGAMIAAQCSHGTYHLMTPQCVLEIVDDDGNPVPDGTLGKVLVTRLDNFAMPLIRYYLGDLAIKESNPINCPCGRKLPQLRMVIGRDTDIVHTRSGKHIVVHAFTGIFEHIPEIKQFRVIQRNLDGIEIEYIPDQGFSDSILQVVQQKIWTSLKENLPITFIKVDSIPNTASGKPQLIQSFLNQSNASK